MNPPISQVPQMLKKLYHLNKLHLTEFGPEILDQQVKIVPGELFTWLIAVYADNPSLERELYEVMKRSVYDFCVDLGTDQGLDDAEMLNLLLKMSQLFGYGTVNIKEYDGESNRASFYVWNLPSHDLEEEFSFKGDTYWAGMLAGGMSYVFGSPVEALETQCILEGAESCDFVIAPRQTLKNEFPELFSDKFEGSASIRNAETLPESHGT